MQLTPPYLEDDFPEDDDDSFEVPGIDDCDHLFSASSHDGNSSVYCRVHPKEDGLGPNRFAAALTVDCEHFTDSLPADEGPHDTPEGAFLANVRHIREWFKDNSIRLYWCENSKPVLRRFGRKVPKN
jgi:hypothetical protein